MKFLSEGKLSIYHNQSGLVTGQLDKATHVLDHLLKSDTKSGTTVSYTSLMTAWVKADKWEDALDVYEKMRAAAVQPNIYTYNVLIAAHQVPTAHTA